MTTQNLVIGFAALAIVLGAWSIYAGKGVPWHQQSQGQGQQRSGQQQSGQRRSERQRSQQQRSGQQGQDQHEEQEEPEGDPADWEEEELKVWLKNRGETVDDNEETRVMLLARVQELRR